MSLKSRIEALEASAGFAPKVHCLWDQGDTAAKIAALVAAGTAQADDKFVITTWASGPEKPMNPDSFRSWPHRDTPPPADNDG
jgi:hypothetical protein